MSLTVPAEAVSYLVPDNSHLLDLKTRYANFNSQVTNPMHWVEGYIGDNDILDFRGDNAYVWQLRGDNMNAGAYALTTYYLKSIDHLGLLDRLQEDGLFGVCTFEIAGRRVSRDLLDSITEILFLEKHLQLSARDDLRILDIGAGYGRLAHRMLTALPNLQRYLCADAMAVSTFLSDYYLRFHGHGTRGQAVALDEIETVLPHAGVNLAINIHSFSECRLPAIEWWLALLAQQGVEYLMLVLNANDHGGQQLINNDGHDFSSIVATHGYRLVALEPKYRDPVVQAHAINPTWHHLYRLQPDGNNFA